MSYLILSINLNSGKHRAAAISDLNSEVLILASLAINIRRGIHTYAAVSNALQILLMTWLAFIGAGHRFPTAFSSLNVSSTFTNYRH